MGLVRELLGRMPRVYKTMFGPCFVKTVCLDGGDRVRVLEIGGVYQSATYLDGRRFDPVFSYYYGFDHVFDDGFKPRRGLMIGGGGYSWPKSVVARHSSIEQLDVVEIDPVITSLARKYFYLDECMGRYPGVINLIEGDGRAYLEALEPASYDCMVIDAFSGAEPVTSLATFECGRQVARALGQTGVLVSNVVSGNAGEDVSFLFQYVAGLRASFANVYVLPCSGDELAVEDNYIVYATNGSTVPDGALPYEENMLLSPLYDGD